MCSAMTSAASAAATIAANQLAASAVYDAECIWSRPSLSSSSSSSSSSDGMDREWNNDHVITMYNQLRSTISPVMGYVPADEHLATMVEWHPLSDMYRMLPTKQYLSVGMCASIFIYICHG